VTFRLLITGSRDWTDAVAVGEAIYTALDGVADGELVVVHGACPTGADRLASKFCEDEAWWFDNTGRSLIEERHPARWSEGRSAGPRRNAEMVALGADVCLAFILNGSPGATHCANAAEKAGIPVRRFERHTGPSRQE
jgi:hypothetical protein